MHERSFFGRPLHSRALQSGAAMLLLRLIVGPIMAYHGYRKLDGGVAGFVRTVDRLGFPAPELLARATIVIELVGGICLLLGLLTRLWAGLLSLQMLLIVFKVKWDVGLIGPPGRGGGFELDLTIAVIAAALLLAGPGLLALDHLLGLEADPSGQTTALGSRRERARA